MAKWRIKAYEIFGFKPGSYSSSHGKVELLTDLFDLTRRALQADDDQLLDKVIEYVQWAAAQESAPGLTSAVDLAFFLPAFRDHEVNAFLTACLPQELITTKRRLLTEEPA